RSSLYFSIMTLPNLLSTLFPYTTLFRSLIDAGERAARQVKALHSQGVRFCLVDFGRDWAAVHALKNLDVDFVRLAPNLVTELGKDRKSTRLNSSHVKISYAVFCLKKKKN